MITTSITLQEVVAFLNGILELDPEAVNELFQHRRLCNQALAEHPSVQVRPVNPIEGQPDTHWIVGLLGIINGFFGAADDEWGAIAADIDHTGVLIRFYLTKQGQAALGDGLDRYSPSPAVGRCHRCDSDDVIVRQFTMGPPFRDGVTPQSKEPLCRICAGTLFGTVLDRRLTGFDADKAGTHRLGQCIVQAVNMLLPEPPDAKLKRQKMYEAVTSFFEDSETMESSTGRWMLVDHLMENMQ